MAERETSRDLAQYIPEEHARRVFAKVFDEQAVNAIHKLSLRGIFDTLEFVISTGKEAHIFRAVNKNGKHLAVKIYKIETSAFRHMDAYIKGDARFRDVKKDKRSIVHAWTRKEFKNLKRAYAAGVRVPKPVAFLGNLLVMEFIGDKEGNASSTMKETGPGDAKKAYGKIVEYMARLMYKAGLVHADLSEYNFLVRDGEIVLIDIGQAVLLTHPRAKEFFERDADNIARYFSKFGVVKTREHLFEDVRAWKEKLKT